MAMDDRIKYFIYGLLLSSGMVERKETTVDIPVETIQLSYDKTDLRPDDNMLITATIFPLDATFKDVEWSSSDIDVLAVNKISENTCIIKALQSGSVTVTCKATYPNKNGEYASATVNINVLGNITFDTLKLLNTNRGHGRYQVASTALIFDYTPLEADGKNINVTLDKPISENESPYTVRHTMFDNIKVIENKFDSLNLNDYISTTDGNLGWHADATDGSGLKIANQKIYSLSDLKLSLFGSNMSDTISRTVNIEIGFTTYLFDNMKLYQCLTSDIQISMEGDNCIEIDNQYVVTAKSAGTAIVSINIGDIKKYTITFNCSSRESYNTSLPGIIIVDEKGQQQEDSRAGWNAMVGRRFRAVCGSDKGGLITEVSIADTSQAKIDGDIITPLKPGTIQIRVKYKYPSGTGQQETTRTVNLDVWSKVISCGTVKSDYLKDGIAVWCQSSQSVTHFNGMNGQKVDIVFNANEVKLLDQIVFNGLVTNTLTYNKDGAGKRSASSVTGITRIYQFEKITSGTVTIRFQLADFPDIYDTVDI